MSEDDSLICFAEQWTLVLAHSLWIVAVIGIAAWLVLRMTCNSALKSWISIVGLSASLISIPLLWIIVSTNVVDVGKAVATGDSLPPESPNNNTTIGTENVSASLHSIWISGAYVIGLAAMIVRLSAGFTFLRRIRREAVPLNCVKTLKTVDQLVSKLKLRRAPVVFLTQRICSPAIVGVLKPVLLIPAGFLSDLKPEQVEAVIAHELSHLKRLDHCFLLIQQLAESFLFYHPAVWWLSRELDSAREDTCDDLAIRSTNICNHDYAELLLQLTSTDLNGTTGLRLAIFGHSNQNSRARFEIRRRISRLLHDRRAARKTFSVRDVFLVGILFTCGLLWFGVVSRQPLNSPNETFVSTESGLIESDKTIEDWDAYRKEIMKSIQWVEGYMIHDNSAILLPGDLPGWEVETLLHLLPGVVTDAPSASNYARLGPRLNLGEVSLSVTMEGEISCEGEVVSLGELIKLVKDRQTLIVSPRQAFQSHVVRIAEVCKSSGAYSITWRANDRRF